MTVQEALQQKAREDNFFPIEYSQFCEFDDEEKRWYLSEVRTRYNATDEMVGAMMGVNRATISRWARRLRMEERCRKADVERPKKAFYDWVEQWRGESPGLDWVKDADEPESEDTTKGSLTVFGTLGDVAAMLQALAVRDGRRYAVKVEWGCGV